MTSPLISDAVILSDGDGGLDGRAYCIVRGRRHWIPEAARLQQYGLRWPEDVSVVPSETILRYPLGPPMPEQIDFETFATPSRRSTPWQMREIAASQLFGAGVEFGAGANPFPVPFSCTVSYVDYVSSDVLRERAYAGQREFVQLDVHDSFDKMGQFSDESLDFVIGCHVIEHVRDPLGALAAAHRVLRPGGSLVLVVPDKHRTFDAARPLTALDHLLVDHREPDGARDAEHFEEFYRLAFPDVSPTHEEGEHGPDIHYHVWDYPHFARTVLLGEEENIAAWGSIWSQPTLPDASANEFYFVLRK